VRLLVLVGWGLTRRLVKVRMLLGPAGVGVLGPAGPEAPAPGPVDLELGVTGPGRGGGVLLGWRPAGGLRADGGL
jgi:hypothetical protein